MAYTPINKSTDYFNTKLWTGTGSEQTISGVEFQPDMVWLKQRTSSTRNHNLYDAVRGVTKRIYPDDTSAEDTDAQSLKSFNADGFVLGTSTNVNQNGGTYASWNWKANGQGSSNTDGSINTTYTSVNTTSGVSISKYTGIGATATVGHGLGVVPKVVLIKGVSNAGSWGMYHASVGAAKKMVLNTNAAEASSGWMNSTAPTNQVFTVINDGDVGTNGYTYVAYSFADVQGYSKFGSYTGNGNAVGPFVYTGFKPAFLLIKKYSATEEWIMTDNKRIGYNNQNYGLFANTNAVEQTGSDFQSIDLLSNGFKMNVNTGYNNGSGATYIYMAFAEAPLVGSNNVPANAR